MKEDSPDESPQRPSPEHIARAHASAAPAPSSLAARHRPEKEELTRADLARARKPRLVNENEPCADDWCDADFDEGADPESDASSSK